jgi:inorganic triphosphatase YgiF
MTRQVRSLESEAKTAEREIGSERELKFVADRKTFKAALTLPLLSDARSQPRGRRLTSVYFDTDEGDLSRARVALRVRRSRGGYVMGLKQAAPAEGGAFERRETEVKSTSAEPDLALLDDRTARLVTEIIHERLLKPSFRSEIRRVERMIEANGATIEVAFDSGFVVASHRREPVREIELELKSGEPAALFDLGLMLVDALPVRIGVRSKAEQAQALLSGAPPEPARAESLDLRPDASMDQAIGAFVRNCLSHFLGNLPALEKGDAIEAVHQMRVAMRRLRAALGLVGRAFPSPALESMNGEAKRIAAVLGAARDWDVLIDGLRAGPLQRFGGTPGFNALIVAAEAKAKARHAAVSRLVAEKSVPRFVLSLERFVASRAWRDGADQERLTALDEPAAVFAARSLERLDRKVHKRGRRFRKLTPEGRHALRIALKHMRYATEFFGGLFHRAAAAERYGRRAAKLQDLLGKINDATIALRLVGELGLGRGAQGAYAAGVAAGWSARASLGDEEALRKAWRALVKAKPYWRDGGEGHDAV